MFANDLQFHQSDIFSKISVHKLCIVVLVRKLLLDILLLGTAIS